LFVQQQHEEERLKALNVIYLFISLHCSPSHTYPV
jgi:hypothetical protein